MNEKLTKELLPNEYPTHSVSPVLTDEEAPTSGLSVSGDGAKGGSFQLLKEKGTEAVKLRTGDDGSWNEWNELYHEGHKPTPADIGAVSIEEFQQGVPANGGNADTVGGLDPNVFLNKTVGGTVTGTMTVRPHTRGGIAFQAQDGSIYTNDSIQMNNKTGSGTGTATIWYENEGANKLIKFDNVTGMAFGVDAVYHEGNKPQGHDIGAGELSGRNTWTGSNTFDTVKLNGAYTPDGEQFFYLDGNHLYISSRNNDIDFECKTTPRISMEEGMYDIYHEGNLPVATDAEVDDMLTSIFG